MLRACLGPSPFGFWLNDSIRFDLAAAATRLSPLPGLQATLEAEIFAADALLAEERAHAAAAAAELRASAAEVVWLRDRQQEAEARAAYIARLHEEADRRAGAAEAELAAFRAECGGARRALQAERRAHELCAAEYSRLRAATNEPELTAMARRAQPQPAATSPQLRPERRPSPLADLVGILEGGEENRWHVSGC